MIKSLINSKLPLTLDAIFKNLNESSAEDLKDKIIEFLINIFINFMKSKEYCTIVYTNLRNSIEYMKNMISNFKLLGKFTIILESCQIKMINLFQIIIEYENKEITKDQVLTPMFFKQLLLQIPLTQDTLRVLIDKCIQLIENPFADRFRKSIVIITLRQNQSNLILIRELNELSKTTLKVRIDDRKSTTIASGLKLTLAHKNSLFESEIGLTKRKSLICMNDNPEILNKFERIITSISNLVEIM